MKRTDRGKGRGSENSEKLKVEPSDRGNGDAGPQSRLVP